MATKNPRRNQVGDRSRFGSGIFDGVQSRQPRPQILLVLLIPLGDAGVYVPAVVVETRLAGESLDFGARLLLKVSETHHDISDLHAGVIDVILDVDLSS